MLLTKQIRDCRIGDIIRFKNKERRLITRIDYNPHKSEPYAICAVDLRDGSARPHTPAVEPFNALSREVHK